MREIKFGIVIKDASLDEKVEEILKLGAQGCLYSYIESTYPDDFFIITDVNLNEASIKLDTLMEVKEEDVEEFIYADPDEENITILHALHELKKDFEVPEIGVKFIYVGES